MGKYKNSLENLDERTVKITDKSLLTEVDKRVAIIEAKLKKLNI